MTEDATILNKRWRVGEQHHDGGGGLVLEGQFGKVGPQEHLHRQHLGVGQQQGRAELAVLDEDGVIVEVNDAWLEYGRRNGAEPSAIGVGAMPKSARPIAPGATTLSFCSIFH